MNPVIFFIELIKSKLQLDPEEFQNLVDALKAKFDASNGFFARTLRSPYVLILLPVVLPIAKAWVDKGLSKLLPDQDGDGDSDFNDALAIIVNRLNNKQLGNG